MKRVLSLILVLSLVLGMFPATFAEETATAGEMLKSYSLLEGDDEGNLNEEGTITRAEMMTVLARLLGKEDAAKEYTLPSGFADIEGHWNANVIAYAKQAGWTEGVSATEFDPEGLVTEQQANTFILRALGYTDVWATANEMATELGINTPVAGESILRGEVFETALKALSIEVVGTDATLGATLEIPSFVDGTMTPVATEVVVESAKALNATTVEVALDEDVDAPAAVDAALFTVMAGTTAVEVMTAEFAAWDTDNFTVVLTTEAMTAGTLYTVTSGDVSVNFGGLAADTTEPTVTSVNSTDYNEVTVVYSEAIDIDTVAFEITEKYGDKAELAVLDMVYDGADTVVLTTASQADSTLYSVDFTGATDLAGNVLEDETKTFVGQEMPTDELTVTKAKANDYNEVTVQFNVKVDPATLLAENFTITEKYGDKADLAVLDVKLAEEDDLDTTGTALTTANAPKYAILTVADLNESTLYELEAANLDSLYGKALDSDETTVSFVGTEKPDADFTFTSITASSNVTVDVEMANKLDADSAEDITMYTIVEKYGDKAELVVVSAELQSDDKTVELTVADMGNVLYEMTVDTTLADIYGNTMDTDSDANVKTFVGAEVADKIESISSIVRGTNADTEIVVTFNENVGANATDVSYYNIDKGVGYPTKAAAVSGSGNEAKILLTIPKTTEGTSYKLTVAKGIENGDGIVSTDELTKTFAGKGDTAGLPQLEAVLATDDHTIELYFDRAVTDATIDGVIWSSTTNAMLDMIDIKAGNVTSFTASHGATLKDLGTEYAYESSTMENVLVVRYSTAEFTTNSNYDVFDIKADATVVDDDYNELEIATNATELNGPMIEAVQGLDDHTVLVYMDGPTLISTTSATDVASNLADFSIKNSAGTVVTGTLSVVTIPGSDTQFKLVSTTTFAAEEYTLIVVDAPSFKDLTDQIAYTDTDTDTSDFTFAGSAAASNDDITDISVMGVDARTLEVYFPVDMDNTDVYNEASYQVLTDLAASDAWGDASVKSPSYVEYDDETKMATLYFAANIATTSAAEYYVAFDTAMTDVSTLRSVIDDTTRISIEFALDTDAAAEPNVVSATLANGHNYVTVKFDQDVAFTADGVAATINADGSATKTEISDENVTTTWDTDEIKTYFAVTGKDVNENALVIDTAVRKDNDEVKIYFVAEPKLGAELTIETLFTGGDIVGITGNVLNEDNDADDEQEVIVSVPSTKVAAYDTVAPKVVSIAVASNNTTTTLAKDTETVTYTVNFSEAVTVSGLTATTAANVATAVTTDLDAVSATSDTIVFTVAAGDTGAVSIATAAFTITDGNSNATAYANIAAVITDSGAVTGTVTADTTAPTMTALDVVDGAGGAADEIDVTFSEAVFTNAAGTTALADTDDALINVDTTATDGSGTKVVMVIDTVVSATNVTGSLVGAVDVADDTAAAVAAVNATTLYDAAGNAMAVTWRTDATNN